jgi:hypothetical protein
MSDSYNSSNDPPFKNLSLPHFFDYFKQPTVYANHNGHYITNRCPWGLQDCYKSFANELSNFSQFSSSHYDHAVDVSIYTVDTNY